MFIQGEDVIGVLKPYQVREEYSKHSELFEKVTRKPRVGEDLFPTQMSYAL